ncbi:MAG: hypothetical protein Q4P05_02800 [Actinomycetaceae bacterium]|nr:hypothetical protein [Actinomycetaceae bacterium]
MNNRPPYRHPHEPSKPSRLRTKGRKRFIVGIVLVVIGALALYPTPDESGDSSPVMGALIFIGVGIWLILWGRKLKEQGTSASRPMETSVSGASTDYGLPDAGETELDIGLAQGKETQRHHPKAPHGRAFEPWARLTQELELVGGSHRQSAFRTLLVDDQDLRQDGFTAKEVKVALVTDGDNPHDAEAVSAWIEDQHVAYLPREQTSPWNRILRHLESNGQYLLLPGRLTVTADGLDLQPKISIKYPELAALIPRNSYRESMSQLIPQGRKIQVTGEEDHMDNLIGFVESGREVPVYVTLRAITITRPRSVVELVQVELNGQRVGVLSSAQSQNFLPLVNYLEQRGKLAVARAIIVGSKLKADVYLYSVNAAEIEHAWLDAVADISGDNNHLSPPDEDW